MKKVSSFLILSFFFFYGVSNAVFAGTVEEEFKIEGLISPASPKALKSALEKELGVKVIGLNLKRTKTGWPVLKVQFDSVAVSKEKIERIAIDIETALLQNHGSEIKSDVIGQMVLNELIKIDKVSYIRFSSVYRDFQNEDSFVDEIDKLKTENNLKVKEQMEMFPTKKNRKKIIEL